MKRNLKKKKWLAKLSSRTKTGSKTHAIFSKFRSVQFSHSIMSDSLQSHGLQNAKLPCPSPTPGVYSNSCPLSQRCHPTILFSVILFFSCLQSFPASRSFPVSQFFSSGGQSIGVSASAPVLLMNIQDWFPLGLTGLISLQSKGLSRVFNTTVQLVVLKCVVPWTSSTFSGLAPAPLDENSMSKLSNVCLNKPSKWSWYSSKLEKPCPRAQIQMPISRDEHSMAPTRGISLWQAQLQADFSGTSLFSDDLFLSLNSHHCPYNLIIHLSLMSHDNSSTGAWNSQTSVVISFFTSIFHLTVLDNSGLHIATSSINTGFHDEWIYLKNGYMYMYGWVPLLFTWNYHNIVHWLYSNTKCFWC